MKAFQTLKSSRFITSERFISRLLSYMGEYSKLDLDISEDNHIVIVTQKLVSSFPEVLHSAMFVMWWQLLHSHAPQGKSTQWKLYVS